MITFLSAVVLLILGYLFYGRIVERVFGADVCRKTPAVVNADGVDYVEMPWWRIFLIQFLNIAGLGPIFGAIMGVMFGPSAFLWIVFGSIFAGAVHDYLSGMMSVRSNGASMPELVGNELGQGVKRFVLLFAVVLLVLVCAVFVSGPANLLANMTPSIDVLKWTIIIFAYYVLATLLPIDKLIGKVYPIFGAALLFMAVGIFVMMIVKNAPIPELTDGLANCHPQQLPIFPMMFVSIACGAISGFHATQSPLMARCLRNEQYGRRCFYGAMIAEGLVALIWAAAASSFFGSVEGLQTYVAGLPSTANKAADVVNLISNEWLGRFGGMLALLGVVAAPITTGDTALRSARLIVADFLHIDQRPIVKRLLVSVPIFLLTIVVLNIDFDILWRYFAWCNQMLAVFMLWAITVYLAKRRRVYAIALLPALFMTCVTVSYILIAPEGFRLPYWWGVGASFGVSAGLLGMFFYWKKRRDKNLIYD